MAILRPTLSLVAVACWCAIASVASAETLAPENGTSSAEVANDLAKFSEQLMSDSFSERRQASQELSAAGVRALPVLEKTARGGDREATARAMTIIQQQFISGDQHTRDQAEAILQRIAAGENQFAARRAEETLHPEATAPDQFHPVFGNVRRGNRAAMQAAQMQQIQQMRIQIAQRQQQQQQQAQLRRINIRNVNGQKTITVTENDRTVKISEKPGSIEVEVTEKKNGKETTEKYAAKNAEQLKKKHPEAYKLYKEHNQGGAIKLNARIQIQGNAALPAQIRLPNVEQFKRLQKEERDDS